MKKRFFILAALCLSLMAATAVALAANRPAPFDFNQLSEGEVCPNCHAGVIYMAEGPQDKDFERCPVSGYHHVIDVMTWDWACTSCGWHFARAGSMPIGFFCAEAEHCQKAQEWNETLSKVSGEK